MIDPVSRAAAATVHSFHTGRTQSGPGKHGFAVLMKRSAIIAGATALAVTGAGLGFGLSATGARVVTGTGTLAQATPTSVLPRWGGGSNGQRGAPTTSTTGATTAQQVGVVDIDTVLGYQNAEAAGTGMVLTASGEVLTNNHVVEGATSITVTVVSTGRTYRAGVVGTDPIDDIAVLQLTGASGLRTAKLGDSSGVAVGDAVTGVGNAGGGGGTPTAAAGAVTALDQAITATDESGANAEKLTGLIEVDAQIEAGDSGGPLYDAPGRIIGMDTAAQADRRQTVAGYAIPIDSALSIAATIESATTSTETVHLGYPAFLGVSVAPDGTASTAAAGATVAGVLDGTAAAKGGLVAGDVITSVGGVAVTSAGSLEAALHQHRPGDSVRVRWTDTSGQSHRASLVLTRGPAD
jgi:S1-C subfamily serine protease